MTGDRLYQAVLDASRPRRPVVARQYVPNIPPWCVVFTTVRGERRTLRYWSHRVAVARAHEVAGMLARGVAGEFYSRDEILVGMGGTFRR